MERCLSAYSSESWDRFMAKIKEMPKVKQIKMRPLFSHAAKCELDSQGRILLPQALRDFAGLTKNVARGRRWRVRRVLGRGAWDQVDMGETTPENIAQVLMELDF